MDDLPATLAESGEKALEVVHTTLRPDIILLDISLPGIDGFEVLKQLKDNQEHKKAISCYHHVQLSREEDIEWGKKLGAAKFVQKSSLVPADVVDMVRQFAKN